MGSTRGDMILETCGERLPRAANAHNLGGGSAKLISLEQWQEFVDSRPESTPFHHREWISLIRDQYGFQLFIPAIVRRGEVAAGLPFALTRTLLGSRKLLAFPFTDYMPVLAADPAAAESLRKSLADVLAPQCKTVIQKADHATTDDAAEFGWYRHEVDTRSNYETIASRFSKNTRRHVRRAYKNSLTHHRRTDVDAMNVFYSLHVRNRRRLGVPVQPHSFFARIYERVIKRDLGFIDIISSAGQPISASACFSYHGTLISKYLASDENAWELQPNEFLDDHLLRRAAEDGTKCVDFGVTPVSQDGLLNYKRKWGGQETAVGFQCYSGTVDQSSKPSRLLTLAAPIIRKSPSVVCRMLGEFLYKYSS